MASILLSAAGSAVGAATGVPFASTLGMRLGRSLGGMADTALLGSNRKLAPRFGPRLAELSVQTSTYGKVIPVVYGTVRIGGNIIWSRPIQETATTSTSSASTGGGKGGGGKVSQTTTTYSYSVTLAIAICEGPIDAVLRIWADAKQLDLSQYTIRNYTGSEAQTPDSLIQSIEGAAKTPAYRGLAYVVIENFPLADFGNRIPNFTFEVKKKALYPDVEDQTLEEMITGMVMIPGAGEFVYDTLPQYKIPGTDVDGHWIQQGTQTSINMHNASGTANALVALDQLQDACPNIEWVSVVVSWFGDSTTLTSCVIKPGVEYQNGAITSPDMWQVAGFTRETARQITLIDGSPQYGGTPDDDSVLRYLDALKTRGYKIMFYPMLFMDTSGKPWRGELTGAAGDISNFFTKTNGYNAFITHYANLAASKVDGFIIGSELKGLTKVTDTPGNYPAVNELVSLAASVKGIVGSDVKVTYAADWSEYHHADGGWYNLDPLWACPDIDVIGIDAYFPLTNASQSGYDIESVKDGWTSGEGYDFYFTDSSRTTQASLSAPYAWKNLQWFWQNTHTNPDSSVTDWVPESKKIWFTEIGFPSVDGAANQPNVFYDPISTSSAFPYLSKGRVDLQAQRTGLTATHLQWQDSEMVERMFVWTWDARPYPYWPDLTSIWSDGAAWKTGHWVQGKLGLSSLAAIVADLCTRSGLSADDIDVSQLTNRVDGYIIGTQQSLRESIEALQLAYFFDAVESDHILKFVPRGSAYTVSLQEEDLVASEEKDRELLTITRTQEVELPRRVNIVYISRFGNYQSAVQYAERSITESLDIITTDIPLVLSDQAAKTIADVTLFTNWMERTSFEFGLSVKYAQLEPCDILQVTAHGIAHQMRIISTHMQAPGVLQVQAVAEDVSVYDFYSLPAQGEGLLQSIPIAADTQLELLDLPAFPGDDSELGVWRLAAAGLADGWSGAALYRSDDNGDNYIRILDISSAAVIGASSDVLAAGPHALFDDGNSVTVLLLDGELQSVSELAVLNGANVALLGNEIIQFRSVSLIGEHTYRLSNLLRGRLGTEWAIDTHNAGERFILLNGSVVRQTIPLSIIGLPRSYKPVSYGATIANTSAQTTTYSGIALKPLSPVHIASSRDGSGNISIQWIRRTRAGGDWQDWVDIPLREINEAYEIDIMDGGTVKRTLTGLSSASAAYSAADQTTDFGGLQSSVDVRIYQLSGLIGRGYAGVAEI